MDFSEFFTLAARDFVPLAWRKGLLFLFDVRGPYVDVPADAQALRDALQRLATGALDLLDDGFVFVSAQTDMLGDDTADLAVSVAGTGHPADDRRIDEVLRRLGLHERAPRADASALDTARVASGRCPHTGGAVSFVSNRRDGLLFGLDLNVPARPMDPDVPTPDAEGARAWLVSHAPLTYQSLVRRLQRLGWDTYAFRSAPEAAEHLAKVRHGVARPALVIGAESPRLTAGDLALLRQQLPAGTTVVLAASIDRGIRSAPPGIELRHWPISPRELDDFTRRAAASARSAAPTVPAGLAPPERDAVADDGARRSS